MFLLFSCNFVTMILICFFSQRIAFSDITGLLNFIFVLVHLMLLSFVTRQCKKTYNLFLFCCQLKFPRSTITYYRFFESRGWTSDCLSRLLFTMWSGQLSLLPSGEMNSSLFSKPSTVDWIVCTGAAVQLCNDSCCCVFHQCPVNTAKDVSCGLFICSLFADVSIVTWCVAFESAKEINKSDG